MEYSSKRRALLAVFACTFLLSACATTAPRLKCCYEGEAAAARLSEVVVQLEDGRRVRFGELFPDYTPTTFLFAPTFPVYRLDIARVAYRNLAQVLTQYDANGNGFIEEPELTVLYMREAARGLDRPVARLGAERRLRAIYASTGDVGGLVRLVDRRRSEMTVTARRTFDELDLLRRDFRIDGTEPGEQGSGGFSP